MDRTCPLKLDVTAHLGQILWIS